MRTSNILFSQGQTLASKQEMFREGAMSVPPATVATMTLLGVSLENWVLILTLGWLTFQIIWFIYLRVSDVIIAIEKAKEERSLRLLEKIEQEVKKEQQKDG